MRRKGKVFSCSSDPAGGYILHTEGKRLWLETDNEGDVLMMMMAKLQGSTAKSVAGQQCLTDNGFALPEDVFRQSESLLIDERHR